MMLNSLDIQCTFVTRTHARMHTRTHAHMQARMHNRFTALWTLSGTTRVSRYQKKNIHPFTPINCHQSSLICFLYLLRSMVSSMFNLCAWQSFSTISLQHFFGLRLSMAPSASYSLHFFIQSLSSFCSTFIYHCMLSVDGDADAHNPKIRTWFAARKSISTI